MSIGTRASRFAALAALTAAFSAGAGSHDIASTASRFSIGDISRTSFPQIVRLNFPGGGLCSGTVMAPGNYVLAAAHCLLGAAQKSGVIQLLDGRQVSVNCVAPPAYIAQVQQAGKLLVHGTDVTLCRAAGGLDSFRSSGGCLATKAPTMGQKLTTSGYGWPEHHQQTTCEAPIIGGDGNGLNRLFNGSCAATPGDSGGGVFERGSDGRLLVYGALSGSNAVDQVMDRLTGASRKVIKPNDHWSFVFASATAPANRAWMRDVVRANGGSICGLDGGADAVPPAPPDRPATPAPDPVPSPIPPPDFRDPAPGSGGVHVLAVDPSGAGAEAGFQVGDVILSVAGRAVHGLQDFNEAYLSHGNNPAIPGPIAFGVQRGGQRLTLSLPKSKPIGLSFAAAAAAGGSQFRHSEPPAPPSGPTPERTPEPTRSLPDRPVPGGRSDNSFYCASKPGDTSAGVYPHHVDKRVPLGRFPVTQDICEKLVEASSPYVVCSSTGAGYKPTHPSGTTEHRRDFGFWGSSASLEDCLIASREATAERVCYFGGQKWHMGDTEGRNRDFGSFATVQACVAAIGNASESPGPTPTPKPPSHSGSDFVGAHCVRCHGGSGRAAPMPDWVRQPGTWAQRLAGPEAQSTRKTLENLYEVLARSRSMPPDLGHREQAAFHDAPDTKRFVSELERALAPRSDAPTKPEDVVRLLPPEREAFYRRLLPREIDSPLLKRVLADPATLIYDEDSHRHAYQDDTTPVYGLRTTPNGVFNPGTPLLDERDRLHVWDRGAGISGDSTGKVFHFLSLPKDATGKPQRIKVRKHLRPPDELPTWEWVYPVGTVSAEVHYVEGRNGPLVQEIRVRQKDRADGPWLPDIFRPQPNVETLREQLKLLADKGGSLAEEARRMERGLSPDRLHLSSVSLGRHGFLAGDIDSTGATVELPPHSEALTRALLTEFPFRSTRGGRWAEGGGLVSHGATTKQAVGLVPQHNRTGAVPVTREACDKCHRDANVPFRTFFPGHPLMNTHIYAYGNAPGGDRNLRFHPFDSRQLRSFGFAGVGDNRRIDPRLERLVEM